MKQHITKEQLNDLSDVGKDKLHEWWIANQDYGEVYKIYHPTDLNNEKPSVSIMDLDIENCPTIVFDEHNFAKLEYPQHENWQCLPLLSIGQMIEFLDEHRNTGAFATEWTIKIHNKGRGERKGWDRKLSKDVWLIFGEGADVEITEYKLCDALWEAVKNVLSK